MTTLPEIEKKITDRYGIAQFKTSAIASWMDAQILGQWEEIGETASLKATGTLPELPFLKYQADISYSLAFTKHDETLVSVLTACPPDDISLCIPGFSLLVIKDLRLVLTSRMIQLEMSDVSGEPIPFDTLSASFGCTICLDGLNIPILVEFPSGDSNEWLLEGDFSSIRLGGLKQLTELVGGDAWINSLPKQITQLGNLSINDVRMIFDPTSISLIALEIASDKPLEIIPGKLVLKDPRVYINIDHPIDSAQRSVYGTFNGMVQIGGEDGVGIYLSADVPGMRFYGALAEGSSIDFPGLLSYLGVPLHDAPKFELHDFNLRVDASDPDAKSFSIYARCYSDWEIIPGITFTCVQTVVDYDSINGVDANLISVFNVGGVDVTLSAAHPKGDSGWQFEGSTGAGQEIPIGKLIEDIGKMFDAKPQLPAPLQGLVVKNLGVSFNTNSKDFRFTCESDLPVSAQSSLAMTLFIDVKHDAKGAAQFNGSGKFAVTLEDKTLEFEFKIELASKTERLVAAYHHDGKLPLNVSTLVCALVPGDSELTGLITGMDIAVDLKEIQIAFYKEASEPAQASKSLFGMLLCADVSFSDPFSSGEVITVEFTSLLFSSFDRQAASQNGGPEASSKFLFGLKIGAELSLSSIPLVGAQLPAGQDIGVKDLQLFAASAAILPGDLEQVKNLLVSDKLPTPKAQDSDQPVKKLEVGVSVDAILMLGPESRNLVFAPSGESPDSQEMQGRPSDQGVASSQEESKLPDESAPADKGLVVSEKAIQATQPSVKWIKIQKSFGPFRFDRLGFQYQNQVLWFLLDASLSAAGLTISLEGFGFGSSITKFKPSFELQGLGINFKNDPVEISGAFLSTGDYQYSGQALIKAESFMLSAIGQYANVKGIGSSLFIFAYLDTPLGGPPCFYVTGLAAGFGYNSSVRTPTIEQVRDFPLLAAMVDPNKIGIQKGTPANPIDILAKMDQWIQPQRGMYWLAAGITFRSFEIINSNVLAIAEFGKEFQVLVVGFSTLQLPQEGDRIYAYAELMIQIIVKPAEGVIAAMAQLTPNSYLLDKDCHLTGGFAFYMWFGKNKHAGDFVLTIGGYHPSFIVPDHYPQVPRLGFNWPVSSTVTIKGEAYFALTPSCVMAGGKLEVLYHSGNLQAWFIAQADLIVFWKPFYFEASISVRIGVSYRIKIWFIHKTLKVELGAKMELWGPPTGGKVHIDWWVISFTVSFGAGKRTSLKAVDWDGFKTMLPQIKNGKRDASSAGVAGEVVEGGPTDVDLAVIQICVNNGLLQQLDEQNGKKRWIVRPEEFVFSVETVVPLTKDPQGDLTVIPPGNHEEEPRALEVGIRPMGISSIQSEQTVKIINSGGPSGHWVGEPQTRSLPKAMWGPPVNGSLMAESKDGLVENCLVGLKNIRPTSPVLTGPDKFSIEKAFGYFPIDLPEDVKGYPDNLPLPTMDKEPEQGLSSSDESETPDIAKKRIAIFEALAGLGIFDLNDDDMKALAETLAPS